MQMQNQNLYKKSYTRKSPVIENELPNLYTRNTVIQLLNQLLNTVSFTQECTSPPSPNTEQTKSYLEFINFWGWYTTAHICRQCRN